MRRFVILLAVAATVVGIVALTESASGNPDANAAPTFVAIIPAGYRDWKLISVAHEKGGLNDIRAILGNDLAIKTYREGKRQFPDDAIIARLAWGYVPSEENNRAFGRAQSFVPGLATDEHLQFMVKNSKKYAATGGWGFAQFDRDGKSAEKASLKTCFPCHKSIENQDFVFNHYAP
jgi:hypothetical protein